MLLRQIIVSIFALAMIGCPPKPVVREQKDDYGCQPPPPDVFTSAGVDLKFAQSTFGKVVTGDIDLKVKPEVITLASKAVTDDRIRNYLRCLAIHRDGYTPEQAAYLDESANYMRTNPTADQFLSWKEKNPFPIGKKDTPESINASLPDGLTLKTAITLLAELDNFIVDFKSGCTDQFLNYEVRSGKITARSPLELIELLPLRLKDQQAKVKLHITKQQQRGVYEIQCAQ